MKRCPSCQRKWPRDHFRSNKCKSDGLSTYCILCSRDYERDRFQSLSRAERRRINQVKTCRRHRVKRQVTEYLKRHPCVDCGEDDPVVLEFDHVRGGKSFNICDLVRHGYGWQRVSQEIEKCEVRCANCHRRITKIRRGVGKPGVPATLGLSRARVQIPPPRP